MVSIVECYSRTLVLTDMINCTDGSMFRILFGPIPLASVTAYVRAFYQSAVLIVTFACMCACTKAVHSDPT